MLETLRFFVWQSANPFLQRGESLPSSPLKKRRITQSKQNKPVFHYAVGSQVRQASSQVRQASSHKEQLLSWQMMPLFSKAATSSGV